MKKVFAAVLVAFGTSNVMAQSKVTKSKIENKSLNNKVINAAIGNKSTASAGSVSIQFLGEILFPKVL